MNARAPLPSPVAPAAPIAAQADDQINLAEYWDLFVDNRWLIAAITVVAVIIGAAYVSLTPPVYESNTLIQVEDSSGSTGNLLSANQANSLGDVKSGAAAEMEIIRSRMIIGQAVDNTLLYIQAAPRYVPVIGKWLARRSDTLSNPGFLGFSGYVSGTETIRVSGFDIPAALEGSRFALTAKGGGRYVLSHDDLPDMQGTVGAPLVRSTPRGTISLLVSALEGKPGAEFRITRQSRLAAVTALQGSLKLVEKGRPSGIIDATLQGIDPQKLVLVLNEIGRQYVRQNVERRAAEAEKMLAFLDVQLPQFKKQLDQSEDAYTKYRNKEGSIDLQEEARLVLTRSVELQNKLFEARQKRIELVARFTSAHPAVKTLDQEIAAWSQQVADLSARVRGLPAVQQDALRLQRDVKVNNEAYQSLRNNEMQLQLVREGKVANVRVIDEAVLPVSPVQPKRNLVVSVAAVLGLVAGLAAALLRNALSRAIRDSHQIEAQTGMAVYSTIPLSKKQGELGPLVMSRRPGIHVLASIAPRDPAVESLQSLRTALQFAMLEAGNNRVLVTGPTQGVGKSFISSNFAAIMASGGKRVLLVDADLRKGHLNGFFGIERQRGLSEVIAGTLNVSDAIHKDVLPGLDLLTTGVLPPNPAELMMSSTLGRVLEELSTRYDLVLVDTAPVLVAADTLGVAPQAGTILLVARAEQTQSGELQESMKRLAQVGASATGVLLNAVNLGRHRYGRYGYKYGRKNYHRYSYESVRDR